jgi:hypothetical protein
MRRWAPIAVSLLVLGIAGCGTEGNSAPGNGPAPAPAGAVAGTTADAPAGRTTDYAAADALYRQMMPGLNLPSGITFPDHLPEAGSQYQPNAGLVTAQNFWLCAWLFNYLDSGASRTQAQAATAELAKYSAMDAYTKALNNGGRLAVDAAVKAAQAGNKATVQSFAQNSCGGPFFGKARPGGS